MRYLADMGIVHRDLAARNLLLTQSCLGSYLVKVSDFGLSRKASKDGYYMRSKDSIQSVKWSAPVGIRY